MCLILLRMHRTTLYGRLHLAKMHEISTRRVAAIARQLQPDEAASSQSGSHWHALEPQVTAVVSESSYAKVHRAVSRGDAKWTQIPVVQRQSLSEVIYEKAKDEGIAKVCAPQLCRICSRRQSS